MLRENIHAMPTVLRTGPYRVYFHSHEPNEPPQVYVDRDVALACNLGFSAVELRKIQMVVDEHESKLLEAWNE